MSVKSILVINDYLTICTLRDKKCAKSILARKYLNYKISQRLTTKKKRNSSIFYLILGFILIK